MLFLLPLIRFKDDVKLTPSSRTTMKRNGNEYSLVINRVIQQDEGQYIVRATNSEGTTQVVATLAVEGIIITHEEPGCDLYWLKSGRKKVHRNSHAVKVRLFRGCSVDVVDIVIRRIACAPHLRWYLRGLFLEMIQSPLQRDSKWSVWHYCAL